MTKAQKVHKQLQERAASDCFTKARQELELLVNYPSTLEIDWFQPKDRFTKTTVNVIIKGSAANAFGVRKDIHHTKTCNL